MEVVLLWLDDLDDVFFSAALGWERLRRFALQLGLAASFALAGSELSSLATDWAPTFSAVAAACVGAWVVGTALRSAYYRDGKGSPKPA